MMKPTMKSRLRKSLLYVMAFGWLLLGLPFAAFAGPQTQAGPYHVELTTETGAVPSTGRAKLLLKVTDASGKLVQGATIRSLTKMPGMNMGEREETAIPVTGQPGVYTAPAQFAMEGGYEAKFTINGPQGTASATVSISTGESTGTLSNSVGAGSSVNAGGNGSRVSPGLLLPWLAGGAVVLFILYRMRRTGQRPSLRALANRSIFGGLILLGLILWGAVYAVNHFRRAGAMTPIEVQAMDMNLPAPAGTAPVELATVESGQIESTVRYTGQAVGFVEQDVTPRITGTITMLNVYAGDRVKRGQLLARLDTSQSAPLVANQRAGLNMARQGVGVARKEYQQALAAINEAHAEVGMKTGAIESVRADLTAAQEEHSNAQAQLDATQSMNSDAAAQLQAAQADQQYWRDEISRETSLLKAGAVTQEEYQRERAQAENADAKVLQGQARVMQAQAQIRGAQSAARKAEAMIASAKSKVDQAQAELNSHYAHVRSTEAASDSARQKIVQAQAGVQQAQATLAGASATQGYSDIRSQTDGVVTQRVISPGVLVSPGQTILRISQIKPIRLQANVSESDLSKVRVGTRILVNNQDGNLKPLMAQITSVAPSVDPTGRTGVVEAIVPNQDRRFLPGQYVTMDISTGRNMNTLRIPTRALRYHAAPSGGVISTQAIPSVWVAEPIVGQEGQYTGREVEVKVGLSDEKSTEILAGLKVGQKVVVAGQDYLKNGDNVAPAKVQIAASNSSSPAAMNGSAGTNSAPTPGSAAPRTLYTCLMHPEVIQDHPGNCPMCGMALVPKRAGGAR